MRIDYCPECQGPLKTRKKQCSRCGLGLEALFDESPLAALSSKEQSFVLNFVLCGGNFKAMSEILGLTYPTLRSRLDRIIARLEREVECMSSDQILDAIDRGEINPQEGIEKLKQLKASKARAK